MPKPSHWSNDPTPTLDEELKAPTPHETKMAAAAEKNKSVEPKRYDITSTNPSALRVVHSHDGRAVAIQPGETKKGILLLPATAEYLGRGDLTLTASA